ncbi:MAG TPA: hypothetical protein VD837_12790 [Terriglobales bacterium]|nr:hypothetical protein [Terriglobales bacterium]
MKLLLLSLVLLTFVPVIAHAQGAQRPPEPHVVKYYYKVKWGHQQEFLSLFRKNHLPILQQQVRSGRMVSVDMVAPRYHAPEESRWDYRVTIVFKDAARAMEGDPPDLIKQLYPDQATFKREEQRRFEILEAHWDLPITKVDLEKAQP